jgi:putative FmdB family regulatory protein
MPTYDYKCSNCNYTFEYFQPMSSEPLTECPECKGNLKRIIGTGAGPIFKGSGFYQTDYKSKPAASKNDTKTDAKSEKPKESTDKKTTSEEKK